MDFLRHEKLCKKAATCSVRIQPQSLLPTFAAAKYYSYPVVQFSSPDRYATNSREFQSFAVVAKLIAKLSAAVVKSTIYNAHWYTLTAAKWGVPKCFYLINSSR